MAQRAPDTAVVFASDDRDEVPHADALFGRPSGAGTSNRLLQRDSIALSPLVVLKPLVLQSLSIVQPAVTRFRPATRNTDTSLGDLSSEAVTRTHGRAMYALHPLVMVLRAVAVALADVAAAAVRGKLVGRSISAGVCALGSPVAFAHSGMDRADSALQVFLSGLSHPATGPDHLAAMFAVGVCSMLRGRPHWWVMPGVFVASMALGGAAGSIEGSILIGNAVVETGILVSVIWLGMQVAGQARTGTLAGPIPLRSVVLAYAPVAVFGWLHGYVHGTEIPASVVANAQTLAYAAGFLCGTALIHLIGVFAGDVVRLQPHRSAKVRLLGGVLALSGAAMALARL